MKRGRSVKVLFVAEVFRTLLSDIHTTASYFKRAS
jgi:hypothetical protein